MEASRARLSAADITPVGGEWADSSRIWGRPSGTGEWVEQRSPVDGRLVQRSRQLDESELADLLIPGRPLDTPDDASLRAFCSRLYTELLSLHPHIIEATRLETAFNRADCEEMVLASLEYVRDFPDYLRSLPVVHSDPLSYRDSGAVRQIRQIVRPWGTVAAILPQSAFLFLGVTCLVNGLATGNRVILRAPTQSARSAAFLGLALDRADPPDDAVSIVLTSARTFISAICSTRDPYLIHYLGSSAHAPDLLSNCFQAGKQVIVDGEGNTWVWVDEDSSLDYACEVLTEGALRYNGETCTSINGAVIHPRIYDRLRDMLADRWNAVTVGDPMASDVRVGRVLDAAQAEFCLNRVRESGGEVIAGGEAQENLMQPTLVAEPSDDGLLVTEGIFGPAMWIMPGDLERFADLWRGNRYPLCAGVLSGSDQSQTVIAGLPNLSRLVVNGDPSVEHIYEPWGGYPGTGTNPVSHWCRKYLRTLQVDRPR